jgi:predicted Rossmann-fold nucleotide-binding protein
MRPELNSVCYRLAALGLNIPLPHEQAPNPYVQKSLEFHYFFTRKVMLVKYSCAFIVMPRGLGTPHELFEAATPNSV